MGEHHVTLSGSAPTDGVTLCRAKELRLLSPRRHAVRRSE
jgi:hypothetical protein